MDEKERVLNIVTKYLKDSITTVESVEEFEEFESNLPDLIKKSWDSQNDFFNDLALFLLKK